MDDQKYLKLAVELANKSQEPVWCGSVLVDEQGEVVASNFNSQRTDDLTASHAEMKSTAEANKSSVANSLVLLRTATASRARCALQL